MEAFFTSAWVGSSVDVCECSGSCCVKSKTKISSISESELSSFLFPSVLSLSDSGLDGCSTSLFLLELLAEELRLPGGEEVEEEGGSLFSLADAERDDLEREDMIFDRGCYCYSSGYRRTFSECKGAK